MAISLKDIIGKGPAPYKKSSGIPLTTGAPFYLKDEEKNIKKPERKKIADEKVAKGIGGFEPKRVEEAQKFLGKKFDPSTLGEYTGQEGLSIARTPAGAADVIERTGLSFRGAGLREAPVSPEVERFRGGAEVAKEAESQVGMGKISQAHADNIINRMAATDAAAASALVKVRDTMLSGNNEQKKEHIKALGGILENADPLTNKDQIDWARLMIQALMSDIGISTEDLIKGNLNAVAGS